MKAENDAIKLFFETFSRPVDFAEFVTELLYGVHATWRKPDYKYQEEGSFSLILRFIELIQIPWMKNPDMAKIIVTDGLKEILASFQEKANFSVALSGLACASLIDYADLPPDEDKAVRYANKHNSLHKIISLL